MMWSDKAFTIYMGDAGTDTQFDAHPHASDASDALVSRIAVRAADPCADGEARTGAWHSRSGTSLTDTQLHSAVRG
jgi:hypothetical protein